MVVHLSELASPLSPEDGEGSNARELFVDVLAPSGERKGATRMLPVSIAAHLLAGLAIVLLPLFWGSDPAPVNAVQTFLMSPPPPPPPPLSLGSPEAKPQPVQPKPHNESKQATPQPEHRFEVPQETKPVEPVTQQPVPEQAGSAQGQENGDPQGMLEGVEGGVVGGVPNGVLGGVLGGTGNGPVTDYDEAPRLLRAPSPSYPQDAFVKGINGIVEVEILIDETGRVKQARVKRSIPALDKAALDCVYQWVFQPAKKRGRPVAIVAEAPVTFKLI
jgi:protein TonB